MKWNIQRGNRNMARLGPIKIKVIFFKPRYDLASLLLPSGACFKTPKTGLAFKIKYRGHEIKYNWGSHGTFPHTRAPLEFPQLSGLEECLPKIVKRPFKF